MGNFFKKNKGQITSLSGILIAAITMVGGVFTAKITADTTVNEKISQVKEKNAVLEQRVTSNEKTTEDRLNRLENKIDWLIQQQGGIPSQIVNKTSIE